MCGITGIVRFNNSVSEEDCKHVDASTKILSRRGPDHQSSQSTQKICFGHSRLSIIDTSSRANQPMHSKDGRYIITYNGELYNYLDIKKNLSDNGYLFHTESDTEVLLNAYIHYGTACLEKFNGFFAFAIYDTLEDVLFAARDRIGIKPFYYHLGADEFYFGSELKALKPYSSLWQLNQEALQLYFELTYVPAPLSMIDGIQKLSPGQFIEIRKGNSSIKNFYTLTRQDKQTVSFKTASSRIKELLYQSVELRLVADVPLGTFLSGGIDSSIISLIASQNKTGLETFSLGYKDLPWFDESNYAKLVAKHIGSIHHEIMVTENDLCSDVTEMLNILDEPFADSSALAVYALSKETSKHVKVALSGDGADELFGGYNKHRALLRSENSTLFNHLLHPAKPVFSKLAGSREGILSDIFRKANKYSEILDLPLSERYWRLASWTDESTVKQLLLKNEHSNFKTSFTETLIGADLNDLLIADLKLVLPNDMLTKVDRMSMSQGLEVRTPFLDHSIVDYANSLPFSFKTNNKKGKLLLRNAFKNDLPESIFSRSKKGFEVPIERWLKGELLTLLKVSTEEKLIEEQQLFNLNTIQELINKLNTKNVGDSSATLWSIIVFQVWWKQHFSPALK